MARQNSPSPRTQHDQGERTIDLQADLKLLRTLQKLSRTSWSPTLRANAAEITSAAQQLAAAVNSHSRRAKHYDQSDQA